MRARRGSVVDYWIEEGGKAVAYPAMVLLAHPLIDGEPQALDLHVMGRERHGGFFERTFIERGAAGDVGKWSPIE